MLGGARTTHHSSDIFLFVCLWVGGFFGNLIGLGSKSTEASGEIPVDRTEVWAMFMETNALSFIINHIGSQRCKVHNPIGINLFSKVQRHGLI